MFAFGQNGEFGIFAGLDTVRIGECPQVLIYRLVDWS